jgi:hypothetical protein
MKSINIATKLLMGFGMVAAFSCQKSVDTTTPELKDLNNKSFIKVYMGTVSATRNYVYVDGTPITGAGLATGGIFPSTGYAAIVTPGARNFIIKDTLASSKQIPLTFTQTLEAKKNYTIFMYDTITSPKQLTVETPLNMVAKSTAPVRFVNIIYAKTSVPAVDVYSTARNANLFTNVPTGSATDVISLPTGVTDNIIIRIAGTTTQLAAFNSMVLQAERAYTLVFRGSYFVTSGTNVKTLSLLTNN